MSETDLAALRERFQRAPFIADLGLELDSIGLGECVTVLELQPRHLQQNGVVHAGVQATLADHTAGAAASMLVADGFYVMTAEFKISLLRSAQGERLICQAKVLKPGKQFSFVEAEVFCISAGTKRLIAKASATLAIIAAGRE